jgi:hypothetical protein
VTARREVLLLGAGFSKTVYDSMPTLDQLGYDCRIELRGSNLAAAYMPDTFEGGHFEVWLSRIAEDQPDYDDVRNAENRALFLEVSRAIHTVIDQDQRVAMAAVSDRGWLFDLVEKLHSWQATVITLNYDNLVEFAVKSLRAVGRSPLLGGRPPKQQEVTVDMLVDHLPPIAGPSTYGALAGTMVDTFKLLKLHGSLDWWWAPGDKTGATIARSPLVGGFGSLSGERESEVDRRRRQPGRVPFIVPPTASKSSYYQNPLTRELWARSVQALAKADRLTLFGYSVPTTDLVLAEMLRESLNPNCRITIVTLDETGVRSRLGDLGIREDRIDTVYTHEVLGPATFTDEF